MLHADHQEGYKYYLKSCKFIKGLFNYPFMFNHFKVMQKKIKVKMKTKGNHT